MVLTNFFGVSRKCAPFLIILGVSWVANFTPFQLPQCQCTLEKTTFVETSLFWHPKMNFAKNGKPTGATALVQRKPLGAKSLFLNIAASQRKQCFVLCHKGKEPLIFLFQIPHRMGQGAKLAQRSRCGSSQKLFAENFFLEKVRPIQTKRKNGAGKWILPQNPRTRVVVHDEPLRPPKHSTAGEP